MNPVTVACCCVGALCAGAFCGFYFGYLLGHDEGVEDGIRKCHSFGREDHWAM